LTYQCIQSLQEDIGDISAEVIIIDNGSNDGSVEYIREIHPEVILKCNSGNIGFARACNQGIQIAKGKYLLLLNSDVFLKKGCIQTLLDGLRQHPDAAIAGPCLFNSAGTLQKSQYPLPTLLGAIGEMLFSSTIINSVRQYGMQCKSDYLIGACLLVKRQAILDINGFDPDFFLYAEEADLSKRLRQKGWDICLIPRAKAIHIGGCSGKPVPDQTFCEFRTSQEIFYRKHYGLFGLILYKMAVFWGSLSRLLIYSIAAIIAPKCCYIQNKRLWKRIFLWNVGFRGGRIKDSSFFTKKNSLKINQ
jgi:GT2 family glycosyltransferase